MAVTVLELEIVIIALVHG